MRLEANYVLHRKSESAARTSYNSARHKTESASKTQSVVVVVAERSADADEEDTAGEMTDDPALVAEMTAVMRAIVDSRADATLETTAQPGARTLLAVAVTAFVERGADAALVAGTATDAHAHHHAPWTRTSRVLVALAAHLLDVVHARPHALAAVPGVYH